MITSVFSKSKPINYLIIVVFIILLYVTLNYNSTIISLNSVLIELTKLSILIFSIFLLDFIIIKNNLTQKNNYAILTFAILFALFPETLTDVDLLFSNLFILLALRRVLSLQNVINLKKKIFEAAFWIALATLFYFWAILFFIVLIIALIYYSQNNINHSIIPFIAIAAVGILLLSYNSIAYDVYIAPSNFNTQTRFNYTTYNSLASIIRLTTLFALLIWAFIYYFKISASKSKKLKPSNLLISAIAIIAILIGIIAPEKNGNEFLFLFAPFSVVMANYLQTITERWFKEALIIIFIIVPIICLLL